MTLYFCLKSNFHTNVVSTLSYVFLWNLIVLKFTFNPVSYSKLILSRGIESTYKFIILHVDIQLEEPSFPLLYCYCSFVKDWWPIFVQCNCVAYLFHWCICLLFQQYHVFTIAQFVITTVCLKIRKCPYFVFFYFFNNLCLYIKSEFLVAILYLGFYPIRLLFNCLVVL